MSSYRGPSSDEVLNLTSALVSACPALAVVWLNLVSEDGSTTEEPLSFEVFRPLLECHAVTEFVVGHGMPLWLAESHVDQIAKGWPGLKALLLTPDPNFPGGNVTSEQGLDNLDLGAHSPKTAQPHQLGVVPRRSTSSPETNLAPPHQFEQLLVMDLGVSPIPSYVVTAMGLYLGSLVSFEKWIQCSMEPVAQGEWARQACGESGKVF